MLKLLADFFATLAGTNKQDDTAIKEVQQLKKTLHDTNTHNSTVIAQQLDNIAKLKTEMQEHISEKEHRILELETAVHQLEEASAEIVVLKDKVRVAQNEKTGALALKQENEAHQKKILELEEDNEAAIKMVEKFAKELQKA